MKARDATEPLHARARQENQSFGVAEGLQNRSLTIQLETGAVRRSPTRKRTALPVLQSVQTLRFILFHRAAQFVRPGGTMRLRLTDNAATRQTFTRIRDALAKVA